MFQTPTSSVMMTTMLGFFACADARGASGGPRTATSDATIRISFPIRFMCTLLKGCLSASLRKNGRADSSTHEPRRKSQTVGILGSERQIRNCQNDNLAEG